VVTHRFGLAGWGKQLMLSQQPQDAVFGGANAMVAQAGPDLAISFSAKDRLG
jgi:hypothetical protein